LDLLNGLKGGDTRVPVPIGTIVYCNETGIKIGELSRANQQLIVAAGGNVLYADTIRVVDLINYLGNGGKGNAAATQRVRGEKSVATPPTGGEKKWLRLELRLVADVGLVGGWAVSTWLTSYIFYKNIRNHSS